MEHFFCCCFCSERVQNMPVHECLKFKAPNLVHHTIIFILQLCFLGFNAIKCILIKKKKNAADKTIHVNQY
jgi:hypothetical protein